MILKFMLIIVSWTVVLAIFFKLLNLKRSFDRRKESEIDGKGE